jgi:hypothetical protein
VIGFVVGPLPFLPGRLRSSVPIPHTHAEAVRLRPCFR